MVFVLRFTAQQLRQSWLRPACRQLAAKRPFAQPATEQKVPNNDEPLKYFGSNAAEWRAKQSRGGNDEDRLWYQPYVVTGSTAIFLLYFCVLREENGIDRQLEKTLYDHVDGLEEQQLIAVYNYNKENGLDVHDIVQRLKVLGIDVNQLNTK